MCLRSYHREEEKEVITKGKDQAGNEVDTVTKEVTRTKRLQIVRPFSNRYFTHCKPNIKPKEPGTVFEPNHLPPSANCPYALFRVVKFEAEIFQGNWKGTYKDLDTDVLEIKVWRKRW